MQSHINYKKKNIFIFFSFGVSLETWKKQKIIEREINYYKHLQKKKYKLTFITYGDKNDLKFKKILKNIQIIPIFKNIKKNFLTKYLIFFLAPVILNKKLNKCEIIKTHQISGGLLAVICAFLKNKKLVIRTGWEPTKNRREWDIGFLKYSLLFINSLISYKFSNKIIVTSVEIKKFIVNRYNIDKNKIITIPNSVNVNLFKKFKSKKHDNRAINISRLEKQKNLFKLLDICKLSDIDLDIVGSGIQCKQLNEYAKNKGVNVRFLGQIENNQIPKLLSKYIFYLTSSKIEGSPKTIIEAMSSELPIIGLKADGLNLLVNNGKTGYLFSNIKKLAQYISKIKKNKNHLKKMGIEARKKVKIFFDLKENIALEQKIFEKLAYEKKN